MKVDVKIGICLMAMLAAAVSCKGSTNMSKQAEGPVVIYDVQSGKLSETNRLVLSAEDWRKRLSPQAYDVMRRHGTERPFSCGLLVDKGDGVYVCAGCGTDLFSSEHKFDSGTGWPSFYQPVHENNVGSSTDYHIGYARTEVHCARCGGHLGHVFEDGPPPTGLRYCINGVSLDFRPETTK